METLALEYRIELLNQRRKPWRRVLVREACTFSELHLALNAAMGWTNSHLHVFRTVEDGRDLAGNTFDFPGDEDDEENAKAFSGDDAVTAFFKEPMTQCIYEYDMGARWEHLVVFEGPTVAHGSTLPVCVAGEHFALVEVRARTL